jgi:hypothetical protein
MNKLSKMMLRAGLTALALGAAGSACASILYNVNYAVGSGSIVGTVTTDGASGILSASNFTAWNLTVTGVGGVTDSLTNLNSGVYAGGSKITADATHIFFDFTHDNANPSYLAFQKIFGSGDNYVCASNATFSLTPCYEGTSAIPESFTSISAAYGHPVGSEIIATVGVPEPANWALMIAGFGLVGSSMRRRTTVRVSYA